jgi:hypothetical protein
MTKTLDQILVELHQAKFCSRRQIQRYLKFLKIKPVGTRQIPQRYPADSTAQILRHLGWQVDTELITVKEAKRRAGKGGK